jgi:hypothetical protein
MTAAASAHAPVAAGDRPHICPVMEIRLLQMWMLGIPSSAGSRADKFQRQLQLGNKQKSMQRSRPKHGRQRNACGARTCRMDSHPGNGSLVPCGWSSSTFPIHLQARLTGHISMAVGGNPDASGRGTSGKLRRARSSDGPYDVTYGAEASRDDSPTYAVSRSLLHSSSVDVVANALHGSL